MWKRAIRFYKDAVIAMDGCCDDLLAGANQVGLGERGGGNGQQ